MRIRNFSRLLNKFTELSIITRTNPSEKEDLYKEIAESEVFISFDGLSSLCHEATLLGTPVIIMDDVFRQAYENFDHKLHGFYYDRDIFQLENVIESSANLSEIANRELEIHLQSTSKRTIEILDKIETHFVSDNRIAESRERNEAYHKEGFNFYVEKWGCSPILNCTSIKSVYGFHLLNARPKTFFILRSLYLIALRVKMRSKRIIFDLYNSNYIYLDNEFRNLRYKLNPNKIINQFKADFYAGSIHSVRSVIKISILKFKVLANLLCI